MIFVQSTRLKPNFVSATTCPIPHGRYLLQTRTSLAFPMANQASCISGSDALKIRLEELFQRFKVELSVIVMEIRITETSLTTTEYAVTLRPKEGGSTDLSVKIATWMFGGEARKESGSYGCTWIILMSRTHSNLNRFLHKKYKSKALRESFHITAR